MAYQLLSQIGLVIALFLVQAPRSSALNSRRTYKNREELSPLSGGKVAGMKPRLTQTVKKGGCAAKIAAETLRDVLHGLDFRTGDPDVLIDGRDFDDAGILQISSELALVQTLDFLPLSSILPFFSGRSPPPTLYPTFTPWAVFPKLRFPF